MQVHHREMIGVGLVPREVERRFLGGLGAADERAVSSSRERFPGVSSPKGCRGRGEDAPPRPAGSCFRRNRRLGRAGRRSGRLRQAGSGRFRSQGRYSWFLPWSSLHSGVRPRRGRRGLPARPRDSISGGGGIGGPARLRPEYDLDGGIVLVGEVEPGLDVVSLNSSVMSGLTSTSPWATGRRASGHQT